VVDLEPGQSVRRAMRGAREDDVDAAPRVFAADRELRLAQGVFVGHDGVRAFFATRTSEAGGPSSGEPEHIGEGIVLVPVTPDGQGGGVSDVRATSIRTVRAGQIVDVRGLPGGRRSALRSLGRSA
jgi:hypothetical protein